MVVIKMRMFCGNNKKCCKPRPYKTIAQICIALGIGVILAYIIPYYLLISMLGIGLIVCGLMFYLKK